MSAALYRFESALRSGVIRDRPNRFLLEVEFEGTRETVYLSNPGVLSTVYATGREVVCIPAEGEGRKTSFTAVAIRVDDIYVTVHTVLANDLFEAALTSGRLPDFGPVSDVIREPPLPDHGRTDFRLKQPTGDAYVEVKACTHVEERVGKFPDSPTERGRRHLRGIESVLDSDTTGYVVFVVQRPDVDIVEPFREIDPDFASILAAVSNAGVQLQAFTTTFRPPTVYLQEPSIPVRIPPDSEHA